MRFRSPTGLGTSLALAMVLLVPLPGRAAVEDATAIESSPLVIGEAFTMPSRVLGEQRRINVFSPLGFSAETPALPVLYMPDGGLQEDFLHIAGLLHISVMNGTMRPFLLVGIENTERRRDLTGATDNEEDRRIAPRVGGSQAFRDFLRKELRPEVDRRYRTTSETAIVGESLAGLFVLETYLREPDLFDSYVAIDPSLWWNSDHLLAEAPRLLAEGRQAGKKLWMGSSQQAQMATLAKRFEEVVRAQSPGTAVHLQPLPGETHASVYHPAAIVAFRQVFAPVPVVTP